MKRKNIFGGCSQRLNVSKSDVEYIYYCSNSNIIIADSNENKDIIFLDDNLNFLQVVENKILSGDSSGRFYVIENRQIERYKFDKSVENGYLLDNDVILCISLNDIFMYDMTRKMILATHHSKEMLSSFSINEEFIYLGTCEGNILIFDTKLSLVNVVSGHYDRIQGSAITTFGGHSYLATSSKDCTLKIWKCVGNSIEHIQTLNGHSDWVSSVFWAKDGSLLSSSFDKSVMLWTKDDSLTWSNTKIFGGSKSFYNAFLIDDVVYGQSSSGGFYKFLEDAVDFISGHTEGITSLDWKDSFVLSSSLDKTARIFLSNREVSRPQNHGCPMSVAKFLNDNDLSIISGSQETIIRVLEPTYITYMAVTSNEKINEYLESESAVYGHQRNKQALRNFENVESYKLAAVPAELSLTNDVLEDFDFEGLNEYVLSTTAFNEIKKLYGHYFDVVDLDVSNKHIVSVNKALSRKFSGLFLWNRSFEVLQYLEVHNSTINRVRFSSDGRFIATASKDKTSSLIEVSDKMEVKYLNSDHNRVVWDCAFSHDSKYYSTCSRDKKVIIYEVESNKKTFEWTFDKEVTSLDFNPTEYELLLGLESGEVDKVILEDGGFRVANGFRFKSNSKRINVLRYNSDGRYVAVGGDDWLLSIYEINK